MPMMKLPTAKELILSGKISQRDSLVRISDSIQYSGEHSGQRVIQVSLYSGLSFEVLPDRGLDIGSCWYMNIPVAWRSPLGSEKSDALNGENVFLERFKGGLLATCGPENIGASDQGKPMHGSFHLQKARDVSYSKKLKNNHIVVKIKGTIDSIDFFGRRISVRRKIVSSTKHSGLKIVDKITNWGINAEKIPMLYHFNFGAPMLSENSEIKTKAQKIQAREKYEDSIKFDSYPNVQENMNEYVWKHSEFLNKNNNKLITLTSDLGIKLNIHWSINDLPYMYQWVWPAKTAWALGLEPSNAPLWHEESNKIVDAPELKPEESVTYRVKLRFK